MTKKKTNKKKIEKKVENKNIDKNKENNQKLDGEIKSLIKLTIVVAIILGFVFGLTILMNHLGVFDEGYNRPNRGEVIISYENIIVGNIFNRSEKTYYVAFDEFSGDKNNYFTSILTRYSSEENSAQVYKVDMTEGFNASYKGEASNPSAQKAEDIKVNGPTLIKVVNGKNVLYIEGVDNIEKELLK